MKKAFTLAEMLVCIAIMGVVAMLMFSNMDKKPNNSMVMFRKAYNSTANIVYQMIQNPYYYDDDNPYFNNTAATTGEEGQIDDGTYPQGTSKFCKLFANYINTVGSITCDAGAGQVSFVSSDGIYWYLPPNSGSPGTFSQTQNIHGQSFPNSEIIILDVNGIAGHGGTGPDCLDLDAGCINPDKFEIVVNKLGKLSLIDGSKAAEYMTTNSKVVK